MTFRNQGQLRLRGDLRVWILHRQDFSAIAEDHQMVSQELAK
jgi:hypothetical protein